MKVSVSGGDHNLENKVVEISMNKVDFDVIKERTKEEINKKVERQINKKYFFSPISFSGAVIYFHDSLTEEECFDIAFDEDSKLYGLELLINNQIKLDLETENFYLDHSDQIILEVHFFRSEQAMIKYESESSDNIKNIKATVESIGNLKLHLKKSIFDIKLGCPVKDPRIPPSLNIKRKPC